MQETVKIERQKYIGGSDIPIIMNLSPFKSRFDLLLEKAGYKAEDFGGNAFTDYGNTMESKIRDYLRKIHNVRYVEGMHINGDIRIHTDGEGFDRDDHEYVIEIKTTSQIHEHVTDYKAYLVQLLFYMKELDLWHGTLAVYHRPDDFSEEFDESRLQMFTVYISDYKELVKEIYEEVDKFREDLRKVRENPFITEAELLPQDITSIAQRVLSFEDQLQRMKKVQKKIEKEKENLKEAMIEANIKSWETPNHYKITLVNDTDDKEVKEEYFDADALKENQPKLYDFYIKTRTVIKKGRKGYVRITAPKGEQ